MSEFIELFENKNDSEDEGSGVSVQVLFDVYRYWCERTNHKPFGKSQFGKEIKRMFPSANKSRPKSDEKEKDRKATYFGIEFSKDEIFGVEILDFKTQHFKF